MSEKINWVKIMEDNRETIEEKILEAKREAFEAMQGWHIDVEIDEEGKVWTSDVMSTGSQSISSWNGETFIVCSISSWKVEPNIIECMKNDGIYEEFSSQEDNEDGFYAEWDFLQAKYPGKIEEWEKAEKDWELQEFDASEILDRAIEDQKMYE